MKQFQSDYQGVILKALYEKSPQDVEAICEWIIKSKFLVKPDDMKPNTDTRNGEELIRQRIRNHLRSARPLMLKGYVKGREGKYTITSKGKKYFLGGYAQAATNELKVALEVVAPKANNHIYDSLLSQWFASGVRQIILEGPPGTGKTRLAKRIVENGLLIENDVPLDYLNQLNRYCAFVQFHPSYSYEDFIEGLRPSQNTNGEMIFSLKRGPFFNSCALALNGGIKGRIKDSNVNFDTSKVSHLLNVEPDQIELVVLKDREIIQRFQSLQIRTMGSESLIDLGTEPLISGASYILRLNDPLATSDNTKQGYVLKSDPDFELFISSGESKKEIWLLNENLSVVGCGAIDYATGEIKNQKLFQSSVLENDWCFVQPKELHYFIIDEINRANAAEVFGELLVQLEYRLGSDEQVSARLPYSGDYLFIPDNIFLIGTMNNADRSLLKLDRALLRRFHIVNIAPEPTVLDEIEISGIKLNQLLKRLNDHLRNSFGSDLAFKIGHSYFTKLKSRNSIDELKRIWYFEIFPLIFDFSGHDIDQLRNLNLFPGLDIDASNTSAYCNVDQGTFVNFLKDFAHSDEPDNEAA